MNSEASMHPDGAIREGNLEIHTDRPSQPRLWMLTVHAVLGAMLWFGMTTDWKWDNTAANVLFPLVVGGLAGVALWKARHSARRALVWLCCVPGAVGGALHLAALSIFCGLVLPVLFWWGEESGAITIQVAAAPSGGKTAEVVFYPVGAYSGGNGHIAVFLKYVWLPGVNREVYYRRVSSADKQTTDYLRWLDDDRIQVNEESNPLRIGVVRWETPFFYRLFGSFFRRY